MKVEDVRGEINFRIQRWLAIRSSLYEKERSLARLNLPTQPTVKLQRIANNNLLGLLKLHAALRRGMVFHIKLQEPNSYCSLLSMLQGSDTHLLQSLKSSASSTLFCPAFEKFEHCLSPLLLLTALKRLFNQSLPTINRPICPRPFDKRSLRHVAFARTFCTSNKHDVWIFHARSNYMQMWFAGPGAVQKSRWVDCLPISCGLLPSTRPLYILCCWAIA